eukprot:218522-Chlamydomonas_euryale.AAC.3
MQRAHEPAAAVVAYGPHVAARRRQPVAKRVRAGRPAAPCKPRHQQQRGRKPARSHGRMRVRGAVRPYGLRQPAGALHGAVPTCVLPLSGTREWHIETHYGRVRAACSQPTPPVSQRLLLCA